MIALQIIKHLIEATREKTTNAHSQRYLGFYASRWGGPMYQGHFLELDLEKVIGDFDAICKNEDWRAAGVTPLQIREFCAWRGCPMVFRGGPAGQFRAGARLPSRAGTMTLRGKLSSADSQVMVEPGDTPSSSLEPSACCAVCEGPHGGAGQRV